MEVKVNITFMENLSMERKMVQERKLLQNIFIAVISLITKKMEKES